MLPLLFILACGTKLADDTGGVGAIGDDCIPTEEVPYDGIDGDCAGDDDYDVDGDGFVDDAYAGLATEGVPGSGALPGGDCNDADAAVHPDASEVCNDIDDDCNGIVDDDAEDAPQWVVDLDGDGFAADTEVRACERPDNLASVGGDCDDSNSDVYPGADEVCNGIDDDCNDLVDDDAIDAIAWYADVDEDGHGDPDAVTWSCDAPDGHVQLPDDCDDGNDAVSPDAAETCNGIDDDCDDEVDEEGPEAATWYHDLDGDGFATDDATGIESCAAPDTDFVQQRGDCDDRNDTAYPGATEVCDGADNDCDGDADEVDGVADGSPWYEDSDGDGFGDEDATAVIACSRPGASGWSATADDCDDGNRFVNPDATEICNGMDDDCDDGVDDDAVDATGVYSDLDDDGWGDPDSYVLVCERESWHTTESGDCNDDDAAINPDAAEVCNDVDDDCNDLVDDDPIDASGVYSDLDGDGWGDPDSYELVCARESWHTTEVGDCNDEDPAISPDATEVCNGVDDDCDDVVDPAFYSSSLSTDPSGDLSLNDDASWRSSSYIRLTDDRDERHGSAFLYDLVPGDTWYVSFAVRIDERSGAGADGMTFAFLEPSVSETWISDDSGWELGVGGADGWAIELDTYDNGDDVGDPDSEHVSLVRTGDMVPLATEADVPDLDSGDWYTVQVWYEDGAVLAVVDDVVVIDSEVDDTPPDAWRIGWTAATGGDNQRHSIDDLFVGCPD